MEITAEFILALDDLLSKTNSLSSTIIQFQEYSGKLIKLIEKRKDLEASLERLQSNVSEMNHEETMAYDEFLSHKDDSHRLRNKLRNDWDYAQRERERIEKEVAACKTEIKNNEDEINQTKEEIGKILAQIFPKGDEMVESYNFLKQSDSESNEPQTSSKDGNGGAQFGE